MLLTGIHVLKCLNIGTVTMGSTLRYLEDVSICHCSDIITGQRHAGAGCTGMTTY